MFSSTNYLVFSGNLVADSFVYINLKNADTINATRVFIGIVNSGSIRASFERGKIFFYQESI